MKKFLCLMFTVMVCCMFFGGNIFGKGKGYKETAKQERIEQEMAEKDLRKKIGQMLIIGF